MAIKLEMLRCFSAVAQAGNLAEAAARLGRTQSAISMTLKQLEEQLGQRLFKTDRKNNLTPLGEQVFELARTQLRQFDDTVRAIETSARAPSGLVRIASVPSVAGLILPPVIERVGRQYPNLKIELRDADTEQIIDALVRGAADIGIASRPYSLNGVRQMPLFCDRFGLICAKAHPLIRAAARPSIKEVTAFDFVLNDLCRQIESSDFQRATRHAKLMVPNTLSLMAMVRSTNWVTVLPQTVLHIAPAGLAFREVEGLEEKREVFLMLRKNAPFPQFAAAICEQILETDWPSTIAAGGTQRSS